MTFQLGDFTIGEGRIFVIAEIGNNHNGSLNLALEMIDKAKSMGVDCVKFQMRHLDTVYRKRSLNKTGDDLGTEYVIDLLRKYELCIEDHKKLFDYCAEIGLLYLCTPWDVVSVETLERFGVLGYKVSSADLTNMPLLNRLSMTGKPLIISTGMSAVDEVQNSASFLRRKEVPFALLHCNSTYPAPLHDINLKWMRSLKNVHPLVGYSGHERGINVSLAAAALDACIIERHFTLDRMMEGPDHAASLTETEFKQLIHGLREIEQALGDGTARTISQGEMINRENLGKSLVASMPIAKGTTIEPKHISVLSPGQGLSPQYHDSLIGKVLSRNMKSEDFFFTSDLLGNRVKPKDYSFARPWGIPVRYHDFHEYAASIKPDYWEFHLSYSDMDLNPEAYLKAKQDAGLIVHAPELFADSHLMDLATPDAGYRQHSITQTQRVIDLTRNLNRFFDGTKKPLIVANVGGFTMDAPLVDSDVLRHYEIFQQSLEELDAVGVELIPQTMAPFPWHFGGQRYQNLFVKSDEIAYWCKKLKLRVCFDISHSYLACNHFGLDFYSFAEVVAPYTAHLHLGDAFGLNGEGLQIGDGEIDFQRLSNVLTAECPDASFIPEIWQGHKNSGEGFWLALEKLEGIF